MHAWRRRCRVNFIHTDENHKPFPMMMMMTMEYHIKLESTPRDCMPLRTGKVAVPELWR